MIQTTILFLSCAAMIVVSEGFMNMHMRELYNLYNWRDICDVGMVPGQKKSTKETIRGTGALDEFCLNAFKGWKGLQEAELDKRCPLAQEPACRPYRGANRCTVRIQVGNKTGRMELVELKYCAEGVNWDSVHKGGRLPEQKDW